MVTFQVTDMTCGHCASAISKAVGSVDGAARVNVDLARSLVEIEPTEADAAALRDAITLAGYTPVLVGGVAPRPSATKTGCCCG